MTVSNSNPSPQPPAPELQRLRRRFVNLMIVNGCLAAAAALFAVSYFAFHLAWGLPAFAVAVGAALIAQVRFIWMFRSGPGSSPG
jgi:hypothetical protein